MLFDRLADGLSADGWFVIPNFVSEEDALSIRSYASELREEGEFRRAGIGKQNDFQLEKSVRGDEILWLREGNKNLALQSFIERMNSLRDYLNRTCYLGIKDFESHYAIYPEGTRYARHSDRFRQNAHRVVSFVLYLNPEWEEADGGQLHIFPEGREASSVLPEAGKLVCFRSEIEHEVAVCNRMRYSITGWFLDQPVGLTFL